MRTPTLFRIGGCAGSFAAPSENRPMYDLTTPWSVRREPFRRELYGSRTTCYFLRHLDHFFVIDHGLGIEPVSEFILDMLDAEHKTDAVIHCFQTHFHEDHLSGLRTNNLMFRKGLTLSFYSPQLDEYLHAEQHCPSMIDVLQGHFSESYWPVTIEMLDKIGAKREYRTYRPGETVTIGQMSVHTIPLSHPGGCSGLRFEFPGIGPIVVATDYEPPERPDPDVVSFFDGASLLIADMQYRDDEYRGTAPIGRFAFSREGWGHGTPERILPTILACKQRPDRVRIVHHDPKRSDMQLRLFYEESVNLLEGWHGAGTFDYEFAHDGDVYWF